MANAGMPNSHRGRKLFLHEKIRMRAGAMPRFVSAFSDHYQPMMEAAGTRLFGVWEAASFNSHWPEATAIWELDNYAHLARLGGARQRDPGARRAHEQWMTLLGEIDGRGEGRLVFANPGFRTVAERREENFSTSVVIEEIMTTKPNGQTKYVEELEQLYVPWSEDTGKRWVGSFTTVFRYDEVIHYWACEGGWEVFANHFPSWGEVPDPRIRSWTNVAPALRDGWEDSFLQSLPPNPLG